LRPGKFPFPSCGKLASSGRPTEATSAVGRSKPRGRSVANALRPAFPAATGADFSFALSDFKALGAFFCNFGNFCNLSFLRSRAPGQPRAHLLHLVGSRLPSPYHLRARIQSFQPLAAPFPGDSVLPPSGPLAPRFRRPKRLCSNTDDRPGDLSRDGAVRTNIERLRNPGKKFVERHDQGHGMCSGGRPMNLVAFDPNLVQKIPTRMSEL
jgi:hypothetical protein